jgi:hypothetical protein
MLISSLTLGREKNLKICKKGTHKHSKPFIEINRSPKPRIHTSRRVAKRFGEF